MPSAGGVLNIRPVSSSFTGNSGSVSAFLVTPGGVPVLRIDQEFSFAADNVLRVRATFTNVTAANGIAQDLAVEYRRVTAVTFSTAQNDNQIVTVDPVRFPVTAASVAAFNPFSADGTPTERINPGAGPFRYANFGGVNGAPDGADLGMGLDFDLGVLGATDNTSRTFNVFYAVNGPGQSEAELRAELNALGINYIVSARNGTMNPGDFLNDLPLAAAIGIQVDVAAPAAAAVPEPATAALPAVGLAGVAAWRGRRRGA